MDIEADVLMAAKEKTTAGAVISRLARSGLTGGRHTGDPATLRNGVPVIGGIGHIVTLDHVQSLMDEEGI